MTAAVFAKSDPRGRPRRGLRVCTCARAPQPRLKHGKKEKNISLLPKIYIVTKFRLLRFRRKASLLPDRPFYHVFSSVKNNSNFPLVRNQIFARIHNVSLIFLRDMFYTNIWYINQNVRQKFILRLHLTLEKLKLRLWKKNRSGAARVTAVLYHYCLFETTQRSYVRTQVDCRSFATFLQLLLFSEKVDMVHIHGRKCLKYVSMRRESSKAIYPFRGLYFFQSKRQKMKSHCGHTSAYNVQKNCQFIYADSMILVSTSFEKNSWSRGTKWILMTLICRWN